MLYLKPELVDMSKACAEFVESQWRTVITAFKYTKSGVWGDPMNATAEKGKEYFDIMVSQLTKIVDSEI